MFVLIVFVGICHSLFHDNTPDGSFTSFDYSIRRLFDIALGNVDLNLFDSLKDMGYIVIVIYSVTSNILLLNLLIAVLSNVYEQLKARVDAEYNSVLIKYFNQLRWDH